jgi:SNF family Na+-dependent transporter
MLCVFGGLMILIAIGWNIKLNWIEHPEMTERLIWINHWDQCLAITALFVFGFLLIVYFFHRKYKL